jgi:hypothetical protein
MNVTQLLNRFHAFLAWVPAWAVACAVFALIVAGGLLLQAIVVWVAGRRAKEWHPNLRAAFVRVRPVVRFALLFLALAIALPLVPMSAHAQDAGHKILVALFIVLLGWIALVAVNILIDRSSAASISISITRRRWRN